MSTNWEAVVAEVRALEEADRPYHRIIRNGAFIPVELQHFDEYDYDQKRFLNEEHYESAEAAQAVIDQIMGFLFRTNALQLLELVSPAGLRAHYLQETQGTREVCPHCGKS